jgi:hypothetical protein
MLKYKQKSMRQPFGGHNYTERSMNFAADSLEELVTKVSKFRLNNHLPIGDPEQDILRHYLKNWPWLVVDDQAPDDTDVDQDYEDWKKFVRDAYGVAGLKTITSKEAEDRWKICEKCPFNVKLEVDYDEEAHSLRKTAFLIRRGTNVPSELGYCKLHKADLSIFSILEKPGALSRKQEGVEHADCWLSKKA